MVFFSLIKGEGEFSLFRKGVSEVVQKEVQSKDLNIGTLTVQDRPIPT